MRYSRVPISSPMTICRLGGTIRRRISQPWELSSQWGWLSSRTLQPGYSPGKGVSETPAPCDIYVLGAGGRAEARSTISNVFGANALPEYPACPSNLIPHPECKALTGTAKRGRNIIIGFAFPATAVDGNCKDDIKAIVERLQQQPPPNPPLPLPHSIPFRSLPPPSVPFRPHPLADMRVVGHF